MNKSSKSATGLQRFTLTAMFIAIIFVLAFTPLGMIPLVIVKATTIHIPVILGAVILGPREGALLGTMFGFASLINNTMNPSSILSFCFSPAIPVPGTDRGSFLALIICFVPRILVGVVPWLVYRVLHRFEKGRPGRQVFSLAASGIAGSLTNTLLVMPLIYILFKDAYALKAGIAPEAVGGTILGVVFTNGVAEAAVAGILVALVGRVIVKLSDGRFDSRA